VFLVTGIAWVLVALLVLQLDMTTVSAIATLAGVVFLAAAAIEIMALFVASGWKWLHGVLGVLFLIGGVAAFVWPGRTFLAIAALVGWYLLLKGIVDIVVAVADRGASLWLLQLAVGIIEVLVAFWAIGYSGRSMVLLALWVGVAALGRGIGEIVLAFQIRRATG
jgi:uncharacterized membrane protein HdeD (DUF308 family)